MYTINGVPQELNDNDEWVPAMKNPPPAAKDVKKCKYCERPIIWRQEPNNGRWIAMDGTMHGKNHKDYCHTGEPKFAVGDRIICFWKNETIIYDVTMVDKNYMSYGICQPKNSRKRYSDKTFPFKVIEKVGSKLDKVAATLYS